MPSTNPSPFNASRTATKLQPAWHLSRSRPFSPSDSLRAGVRVFAWAGQQAMPYAPNWKHSPSGAGEGAGHDPQALQGAQTGGRASCPACRMAASDRSLGDTDAGARRRWRWQ